jgi:hypothetical protein
VVLPCWDVLVSFKKIIDDEFSFANTIGQTGGCSKEQKVVSDWMLHLSTTALQASDLYGRCR